jgi:xylulose-5-phosphate/fructose-6-phosphate phosphoketolase
MNHCLASRNYVNVIVADKQNHLQYLDMDAAIVHCTKGIGIWEWASSFPDEEPDLVMASCGDVATRESLAATALLRQYMPDLKIRFVNVVDLFKLIWNNDHPHGMSDREWSAIFTSDKPIVFNFHSYPWLVHRLTYKRPGAQNLHVRGYKEKGNIDTPLELAIRNQTDRYSLAMDALDRLQGKNRGGMVREKLLNEQITAKNQAYENGIDPKEITEWVWPFGHKGETTGSKIAEKLGFVGVHQEVQSSGGVGTSE